MPTLLTSVKHRAPFIHAPNLHRVVLHLLIPTHRARLVDRLLSLHIVVLHVLDVAVLVP